MSEAPPPGRADGRHSPAVWIEVGGAFRGSGFLVGDGLAVTAAHVVAHAVAEKAAPAVRHPSGTWPVPAGGVRAVPARGDGGRFHPYPDLALLTVPGWTGHPVAALAAADAGPGTEVSALGYSPRTPTPGVQPDSLELRVGNRSGDFVRILGDGVREGFSGSMLLDGAGLVVGVVKGSRAYRDDQGGWCTPVSALRTLLGLPAPVVSSVPSVLSVPSVPSVPAPEESGPPPTDPELVDALLAFPQLARAEGRHDLLERMGDHLGLPYSFEVAERSGRRDHLFRLVSGCRHFRDERAALRALYTAMEEIVPYDRALERLRDLVGRAVGGWGDA